MNKDDYSVKRNVTACNGMLSRSISFEHTAGHNFYSHIFTFSFVIAFTSFAALTDQGHFISFISFMVHETD